MPRLLASSPVLQAVLEKETTWNRLKILASLLLTSSVPLWALDSLVWGTLDSPLFVTERRTVTKIANLFMVEYSTNWLWNGTEDHTV